MRARCAHACQNFISTIGFATDQVQRTGKLEAALIGVRPTCQQTHPGYTTNGRQGRHTYPIDVSAACSTPKAPAAALAHMRHGAIHTLDLARTAIAAVQRGPCATSWHVPALRMTVGKGAATAGVLRRRRGQRGWRQQRQEDGHARGRTGFRKLEAVETRSWASTSAVLCVG